MVCEVLRQGRCNILDILHMAVTGKVADHFVQRGMIGQLFPDGCWDCALRVLGVDVPDFGERQRAGLFHEVPCHFDVSGDDFFRSCLNDREQFPCFFKSFFLIGGFQADAFAFMLDLVTEVIGAAFLFLIDGSDIKFDFAFLSLLTHSCGKILFWLNIAVELGKESLDGT